MQQHTFLIFQMPNVQSIKIPQLVTHQDKIGSVPSMSSHHRGDITRQPGEPTPCITNQPGSLEEAASPSLGLTSPTQSAGPAGRSLREQPRNLESSMELKSKTCWAQGLNLTMYLMSNETEILARGVASRKLTPYVTHPSTFTSNPEGAKEISSSVFYFSPSEFSGKGENYKIRSLHIP